MTLESFIERCHADIERLAPQSFAESDARLKAAGVVPPQIRPGTPQEAEAHALAKSFAKPIARGYLRGREAYAALALAADKIPGASPEFLRGLWNTVKLNYRAERQLRELTEMRIARVLKPMIAQRQPSNALRAVAHEINGQAGFPLTEDEVDEVTATEIWFALPPVPAGRHRVA